MNHRKALILRLAALLALGTLATGCTTTYDYYGRPVQTVDPAIAVAGVAAAGIAGYAIGHNNSNRYYGNNNRGYYGGHGRHCRY
jgi:hypothetical protein